MKGLSGIAGECLAIANGFFEIAGQNSAIASQFFKIADGFSAIAGQLFEIASQFSGHSGQFSAHINGLLRDSSTKFTASNAYPSCAHNCKPLKNPTHNQSLQ